jgi:hypothetical protein
MLTLSLSLEFENRLYRAARTLGKTTEEAALAALTTWVEDVEDSQRAAAQLGAQGTVAVRDEGFWD